MYNFRMAADKPIEIELRDGPADGKRLFVSNGITRLDVPIRTDDGGSVFECVPTFGVVKYRPSGAYAAPGIEIWRPQIGAGH
jgi:hypothetical protein